MNQYEFLIKGLIIGLAIAAPVGLSAFCVSAAPCLTDGWSGC